ncbi:ZIP family metal transporter [Robiginitalea myxolifaciens]|nr:ZIP family metal transporter [Robiginitalea myxolifaciens]
MVLEGISKGAEHGHVHGKSGGKFPWLVFFGLGLHAFLEGIPLQHHSSYMLGIILHKIPVALILGAYLLRSGLSNGAIWGFMGGFAVMTPLGGFLGQQVILHEIYPYLSAFVLGILLHVSTIILFESSDGHGFNLRKLGAILFGFLLAFLL